MQDYSYKRSVFNSNINGVLSLLFVGTFALGAVLIICKVAFSENPIANVLSAYVATETQQL